MRVESFGVWVNELERIPGGYGIAWYSPWSCRAFCMRVPLNRIVGSFRAWHLDWRRPCEDDPVIAAKDYGHSLGFSDGERYGYAKGLRHAAIVREVSR